MPPREDAIDNLAHLNHQLLRIDLYNRLVQFNGLRLSAARGLPRRSLTKARLRRRERNKDTTWRSVRTPRLVLPKIGVSLCLHDAHNIVIVAINSHRLSERVIDRKQSASNLVAKHDYVGVVAHLGLAEESTSAQIVVPRHGVIDCSADNIGIHLVAAVPQILLYNTRRDHIVYARNRFANRCNISKRKAINNCLWWTKALAA